MPIITEMKFPQKIAAKKRKIDESFAYLVDISGKKAYFGTKKRDMLVYIRIRNFKSIVDTTIDMRYGEGKAPNGYKQAELIPFVEAPIHKGKALRLSPVMAIYGQNAGGKSTLVEGIHLLRRCLYEGKLPYKPNKLHPDLSETTFEISFVADCSLFTYTLSYNKDGIRAEALRTREGVLFEIDHESGTIRFDHLVTEQYTEERLQAVLTTECTNAQKEQITTLLGKLAKQYPGLSPKLSAAYQFLTDQVSVSLGNHFDASFAVNYLAKSMQEASDSFHEIASYLKRLDIDITGMELIPNEDDEGDDEPAYRIHTYHKATNGEMVTLDFRDESRGTQVLFGLLGVVLSKLRTGGVLVIDEIDRSLHTLLLVALVSLFENKEYNTKGAQLILTAHNTELLEAPYLRVSQISIVTKTSHEGTIARRLCDFDGMKNSQNFHKNYLEGFFSGIPFPIV